MKLTKILLLFCFTLTGNLIVAQDSESNNESTYFFIRHAEKQDDGTRNPHLTQEGLERANEWASVFQAKKIDRVYTTDYFRTKETAEKIAESQETELLIYDPRDFDIEAFKNETQGMTVVVVGHSNTTPSNVNSLIGEEKYDQINEEIHGNLYVVSFIGDSSFDLLLVIKAE